MEFEDSKELLRQSVCPVILSNTARGHRLASVLYARYALPSLICGAHRNLWDLLDPHTSFFRLFQGRNPSLAARQLTELAEEYDECTFLLIPASARDSEFLRSYEGQLEGYFIPYRPDDPEQATLLSPLCRSHANHSAF